MLQPFQENLTLLIRARGFSPLHALHGELPILYPGHGTTSDQLNPTHGLWFPLDAK